MSPLTEESAKLLVDNLILLIAQSNDQRLQLSALETALKEQAPAAYEEYREHLDKLRQLNDSTRILVGLERLKELLQK